MIRTEKYNFDGLTDFSVTVQERTRRNDFNRRFLTAQEKARRVNPVVVELSADSFRVTGDEDEYFVRLYVSDGQDFAHCTCDAGTYNQPCYHALRVINGYIMPTKRVKDDRVFGFSQKGVVFTLEAGQTLPAFAGAVRVTVESL